MTDDDPDAVPYSERAVNDLIARCGDAALAMAGRQMRSRAEAEPIVQEAFLAVIKTWRRSRRLVEPQALLFTTVRRRLANEFRRRDRKPASLVDSAESIDAASKALWRTEFANDMITRWDVAKALLELPHRQRAVLVLRFLYDLEVEIVAEMLGCRPGVVKYAQQKGLENMRKSRWLAGHAGTAEVHQ
ncbi:sigma-70 family RNA polymerase sigma factor [Amycolatopsis sp. NPDC049688]|uniref:RNA polymerase sigma factor n=1 Tax=Amycolatopsis sp. NPDC049688 TaxID=3154733 RepID=UPI00342AE810